MPRTVTFKQTLLTLIGRPVKVGMRAPDFKVVSQDLKEVSLGDFSGKIKVINFFPSLDTPVCDLQVKEFNKKAAGLSDGIVILGISKDLPFAQARFCSLNQIKNEIVLSDYRYNSFGLKYGFLIKELNLLARGALIIGRDDKIKYLQLVREVTASVDYQEVFKALQDILQAKTIPRKKFWFISRE
jgi:thiol peroxidase